MTKQNSEIIASIVIAILSMLRLILALSVITPFRVCCSNVEPVQRTAYFSMQKISRSPDVTIISETLTTETRTKCAYSCAGKRRHSLYYIESTRTCHCNQGLDSNTGSVVGLTEVIYGEAETLREDFGDGCITYLTPQERDCLQLYQNGAREDGVYTIQPVGGATVNTWCDMTNGGWTVFQRRQDGSENFFRNWNDYVTGFGDKCGEYWLGLETIHLLTEESSELHISLITFGDVTPTSAYTHYSTFAVGNSASNYKLSVAGFTGSCGDSLGAHSGHMFSTVDNDHDVASGSCANSYKGGWWYSACHRSNLNGLYLGGIHTSYANGIEWYDCWDMYYSLKETVMKVRRL